MKKMVIVFACVSMIPFLAGCKAGKGTGTNGEYTEEDQKRDEALSRVAIGIAGVMLAGNQQQNPAAAQGNENLVKQQPEQVKNPLNDGRGSAQNDYGDRPYDDRRGYNQNYGDRPYDDRRGYNQDYRNSQDYDLDD